MEHLCDKARSIYGTIGVPSAPVCEAETVRELASLIAQRWSKRLGLDDSAETALRESVFDTLVNITF